MKLSIIVIFCDKDYKYIDDLYNNLKNNIVNYEYEIIFVSNCENITVPSTLYGYKVYSTGGNYYCLAGRKEGLKYATGDYVWFVDADDSIQRTDLKIDGDPDIIAFRFWRFYDDGKLNYVFPKMSRQTIKGADCFSEKTYLEIHCAMWNKWYKRSFITSIYDKFPDRLKIVDHEDCLINLIALKYALYIQTDDLILYRMNISRSHSYQSNISSLDTIKHLSVGARDCINYLNKELTDSERKQINVDKQILSSLFFRWVLTIPSLRKSEIDYLKTIYTKQELLTSLYVCKGRHDFGKIIEKEYENMCNS
jgi:glycosyltransferase involved in cell wall biosynthesis